MQVFRSPGAARWTPERIGALSEPELRQLQANATDLGETEIAELCARALGARPRGAAPHSAKRRKNEAMRLVSRVQALGMRGVAVRNHLWSRGGVRRSDGMVVFSLWADDVVSSAGACSYLLWAPNVEGSRPWSDSLAGRERLEQCRRAAERGAAEGLLVYGERLEGALPEDRARSVDGADPDTVLAMRVERRGEEYWAGWGASARDSL